MHELEKRLGVVFDAETLRRALTHRSFAYENGGLPTNERLEFLGDSVLGLVVTDHLYHLFPDLPEGQLARLRAAVVNSRALAGVARDLGLGDHILLGRGETSTGGANKSSILADTLEAILGAVYIDRGLAEASRIIHELFDPMVEDAVSLGAGLDWKTSLQELCADLGIGVPAYSIEESGPDHAKHFVATVMLGQEAHGTGRGTTKKVAEQEAAQQAFKELRPATPAK